jgi:large subunit ribosomal protein L31
MQKDIHPKYHEEAKVACACGNTFITGSTKPEIRVELCNACHPFYTGKQKFVDTARRVEKFQEKLARTKVAATGRVGKKAKHAARDAKRTPKVVEEKKEGK